MSPGIDPATALPVRDAAAAALEPDLCRGERERAESDLSHLLDTVDPMFPASSPSWPRSERKPGSAAGYTTMPWQQPCRSAADTPYESCGWRGVQPIRVRLKWPMVRFAL